MLKNYQTAPLGIENFAGVKAPVVERFDRHWQDNNTCLIRLLIDRVATTLPGNFPNHIADAIFNGMLRVKK